MSLKPYYQDKYATIYHGDCLELLPEMPKVDLVLTDPPYGMNALNGSRSRRYKINQRDNWDCRRVDISKIFNMANHKIIWGMNYYCDLLSPHKCFLTWYKPHVAHLETRSPVELAFTSLENKPSQFISMGVESGKQHPTQKPIRLIEWCLGFFPDDPLTFDPFMGSGTTLVAAKQLNRQAIGIEIEEKYCEIAAKRLSQEVLDLA